MGEHFNTHTHTQVVENKANYEDLEITNEYTHTHTLTHTHTANTYRRGGEHLQWMDGWVGGWRTWRTGGREQEWLGTRTLATRTRRFTTTRQENTGWQRTRDEGLEYQHLGTGKDRLGA